MARILALPIVKRTPTPTLTSVVPELQATGSVKFPAAASLADGDTVTLDDGTNPPTVFEMDTNASVTPGNVRVNIAAATTAATVAAAFLTAFNGVGAGLGMSAVTDTDTSQIDLTQTDPTVAGAGDNATSNVAITVAGMTTPTGSGHFTYKIVALSSLDTSTTDASTGVAITTGPSALSATAFNRLTWTDPARTGAIYVYRTAGGASQGLIATVAAGVGTYDDIGAAGDASTAPSTNGTGYGTSVAVDALRDKYVQTTGTFTGTVQLQGSIAGSTWVDIDTAVTGVGLTSVPETVALIRTHNTAYTSGTPAMTLCGHEER